MTERNNHYAHKIVAIVPVFNEAACVEAVIREVDKSIPGVEVVVIDDGSTDNSAQVAQAAQASVIILPYNLGIGGAVQTGYLFASEMEYDFAVRLDGDGQHNPTQLSALLDPLILGQADVIVGSRYLQGRKFRVSWSRSIGVKVFAAMVSLITGQRFTDTTSGFQAANRAAVQFLAQHLPSDYPEIEGLVLLCRAGFRVKEVPVTMRPRVAGQSSITLFRSVYYVFKVSLALLIGLLQPPPKRIYHDGPR
ncbi:MAG: glycosyltransferase family 2 protein [Nitrosomonas ureae]